MCTLFCCDVGVEGVELEGANRMWDELGESVFSL